MIKKAEMETTKYLNREMRVVDPEFILISTNAQL